jgi:hypothetical protein
LAGPDRKAKAQVGRVREPRAELNGTSDCADEVTLSRKGAKSGTRSRKLRSTGTKARTHVGRMRESRAELEKKLEARMRELAEALEQQTATSEVLGVISSSPGELEPVFQAILQNAVRICEAKFGNLLLYDGNVFRRVALCNAPQAWAELSRRDPVIRTGSNSPLVRLLATKQLIHMTDISDGAGLHRGRGGACGPRRPGRRSNGDQCTDA